MGSPSIEGAGRAARFARSAVRSTIGFAVTLALLESALQVGAWSRWGGRWRPTDSLARGGEKVVLCVGDSFTYGYGASSPAGSYPIQLEGLLNESGTGPWKVVNGGWPGQNSWDVLRKIGDSLERFHPRFVYVLVGSNDLWSRPSLHTIERDSSERATEVFEWKWRTGRLLTLIVHRLRLALAGGGGGVPEREIALRGERHIGPLEVPPSEVPAAPASPPDGTDPLGKGLDAPAAEDPGLAVGSLRARVERDPEDLWGRELLVRTLVALGRAPEATEHLDWLRKRHEEEPNQPFAESLLGVLVATGNRDESLRLAKSLADRYPGSVRIWDTIASQSFLSGDREGAKIAIERALRALPPSDRDWRAMLLRTRFHVLLEEDPVEAMGSAIRAFLLDGNEDLLVVQFAMVGGTCDRQQFEGCLRELSLAPEDRERLERLYGRRQEGVRPPEALESHLRQIVLLCRARDARPAFLSYPNPLPAVDGVMEKLSREMGVPRLEVASEFERILRTRRREDLFVPDGHCNEEGYGIMARVVARDAIAEVR